MTNNVDRHGNALTDLESDFLGHYEEYGLIRRDVVGPWEISTRWSGTPDIPFSSSIEKVGERPLYGTFIRGQFYRTEAQAVAGHERLVRVVRAAVGSGQGDEPHIAERVARALR